MLSGADIVCSMCVGCVRSRGDLKRFFFSTIVGMLVVILVMGAKAQLKKKKKIKCSVSRALCSLVNRWRHKKVSKIL